MERDEEYDAYLSMTAAERIDAEYEAWLEEMASGTAYAAEQMADLDAVSYGVRA